MYEAGLLKLSQDAVLSFYDPDPDADVVSLLEGIDKPVLMTYGFADKLISPTVAEYLANNLPHAELYGFDEKGHLPLFTATEEFCTVLRSFAQRATPL